MPIATPQDEAKMKKESLFIGKLEDGDKIILKSHLYWLVSHFLQKKGVSVLCTAPNKEKCFFCEKGSQPRKEYFYFAEVTRRNGDVDKGIVRLPSSAFYAMNDVERLVGEDKRTIEWVIGKSGSGKSTKYQTIKGKSVELDEAEVTENTKKLTEIMTKYEAQLEQRHKEMIMTISDEDIEIPDEEEPPTPEAESGSGAEEDIPF